MNTEVLWTERAKTRLKEILEYISKDNSDRALSFAQELVNVAECLSEQPSMGRMVPEYQRRDIREIIHGNYRIIYLLGSGYIQVLTIRHCSQLLSAKRKGH